MTALSIFSRFRYKYLQMKGCRNTSGSRVASGTLPGRRAAVKALVRARLSGGASESGQPETTIGAFDAGIGGLRVLGTSRQFFSDRLVDAIVGYRRGVDYRADNT